MRTLDSYAAYYAKWSKVWEAQALCARTPPWATRTCGAGSPSWSTRCATPRAGSPRKRGRGPADQGPGGRGAAAPRRGPNTHLKLGRGGLADIEWTVQLLQLRHAGAVPALRTPRTLDALTAAADAGLLSPRGRRVAGPALAHGQPDPERRDPGRGKPGDHLPRDAREKAAVASDIGYPPGASDELVNDYLRHSRRTRGVVDRVFWS